MEMVEGGQNQPKIPLKRMKLQEIGEEVDRISALPDCLLVDILSRLPSTREAIKTGILSKRWKHVWIWIPTLIFTNFNYDSLPRSPNSKPDFYSSVDKILTQCRELKLKQFLVCTYYDTRFVSQLSNWIRYAISHDVEDLNLRFMKMGSKAEVLLDQSFCTTSSLTVLTLQGCRLNPSGGISWKNLRSLCIDHGKLDEVLIENILSGSPLLETLVLESCYRFRRLDITSKSVKNLVFSGYKDNRDPLGDNIIEINAPNLLTLTIQSELKLRNLLLLNVSSLVEANLDYTIMCHSERYYEKAEEKMLKRLILNLRHVKELIIGGSCYEVLYRLVAKGFNFTPNMRFPGVTYSDSFESEDCDSGESEDCDSVERGSSESVAMEMVEGGQNQPKIPIKRMKHQEIVEEVDRISALPDCLLVDILSRLDSTREAIKTGILSKRWKHVWTWIPTLIFTNFNYDSLPQSTHYNNKMYGFFSSVDKILTQCRELKLKQFLVCTYYDTRFVSQLSNWIRYAISHDVEDLNLRFMKMGSKAEVLLDQSFCTTSSLTVLTLQGCRLNPSGGISWKNLRSLCIDHGKLDEVLIENILSGSPLLETLVLESCYRFRRLDITSKSVKNLVFSGYKDNRDPLGDNIIEINAPNLLTLTIQSELKLRNLLLLNVSSLVEANLDYTTICHSERYYEKAEEKMLKRLILNLHHVKELIIGGSCYEVVSRLEAKGFVFPSNLKVSVDTPHWSDGYSEDSD